MYLKTMFILLDSQTPTQTFRRLCYFQWGQGLLLSELYCLFYDSFFKNRTKFHLHQESSFWDARTIRENKLKPRAFLFFFQNERKRGGRNWWINVFLSSKEHTFLTGFLLLNSRCLETCLECAPCHSALHPVFQQVTMLLINEKMTVTLYWRNQKGYLALREGFMERWQSGFNFPELANQWFSPGICLILFSIGIQIYFILRDGVVYSVALI